MIVYAKPHEAHNLRDVESIFGATLKEVGDATLRCHVVVRSTKLLGVMNGIELIASVLCSGS